MKKLISLVILGVALLSSVTVVAKETDAKAKKIEVKCFIELYGGRETIHFRKIKENELAKLPNMLVNSNVSVIGSKQKQKIFKVHECALLNDEFSDSHAKQVDAATPR